MMLDRGNEDEKTAAPAGAGTAVQNQTSVQHSSKQFEGKEKAPNEADSNQNQKEAI